MNPYDRSLSRTNLYITDIAQIVERLLGSGWVERNNGCVSIAHTKHDPLGGRAADQLERQVKQALRHRPSHSAEYDQCLATEETVLRRVALMRERFDLLDRSVLLLGDDDLLSVALASTQFPKAVTVLDIDSRVLAAATHAAEEQGLTIAVARYDVRDEIPSAHRAKFDVVFTDPPYTRDGAKLFLWRAVQALRPGAGKTVYLCLSEMDLAPSSCSSIQQFANSIGLVTTEMLPGFNRYYPRADMVRDAERVGVFGTEPWFSSSLLRLSTTGLAARSLPGESFVPSALYRYDQDAVVHITMVCRSCRFAILNDASALSSTMLEAAKAADMKVIGREMHRFKPFGVTGFVLLAESHIAIHTWPEDGFAVIDFFTCRPHKAETALDVVRRALGSPETEYYNDTIYK